MKLIAPLLVVFLFTGKVSYAQKTTVAGPLGIMATGTEYSKDVSLYRAKQYIMTQILGATDHPVIFESDALSAASSGELTSLVYKCNEKQKEGMLMAFWGGQWNPSGVRYQAYGFKDLPKEKATELLAKIQGVLDKWNMMPHDDINNIYFQYDDLTFLIYSSIGMTSMRVFWGEFDSEWNIGSFNRTKRRFEKKS